jgi:RNA polymerase sigma-70 factor (sigma-E family)
MLAHSTPAGDDGGLPTGPAGRLRLVAGAETPAARPDAAAAVHGLYLRHYRDLARLAYLLVGDTHLAEDVAHEAFARLYVRWDRLADPARALAYLRSIVANLAYSSHRRERTRRRHPLVPSVSLGEVAAASAEEDALGRDGRDHVLAALGQLSERQRAAVVLRHWLRMTEGEIAEVLGCSVGSVRTHLSRGHAALAGQLGPLRRSEEDRHG